MKVYYEQDARSKAHPVQESGRHRLWIPMRCELATRTR